MYSAPSASGVQRMARVTVTNGRCASRATVLALSKPTYEVMARSRANPSAECGASATVFGDAALPVTAPPKAIINTTPATTIANSSTASEMRADSLMPRTMRISAAAPTNTVRPAMTGLPAGTPTRPNSVAR